MDVGVITASLEPRFGLAALHDKRLVVVPDMPANIHKLLTASDFQSMTTGDVLSIAEKFKTAFNKRWLATMFWVGNCYPKWADIRGSIQRRSTIFKFENLITERITNLVPRIIKDELVAVMLRCITKYRARVVDMKGKDFWECAPERLLEWSTDAGTESDPMAEFITNGSDYYQIIHEKGAKTKFHDLARAFKNYMTFDKGKKTFKMPTDMHCIKKAGFVIKLVNTCKVCAKHSTRLNCGTHYNSQNRSKTRYILNMRIVKLKDREQHHAFFVE
jgi:phage/plasmid-associated DNA primase